MKTWRVADGVLHIEEKQPWLDAFGQSLFGMLFGGIFGGAGSFLFISTFLCAFGCGPMIPGNSGLTGIIAVMLFSLPFIGVGGWILWESLVPVRGVAIHRSNHFWTLVTFRSPRLFRHCALKYTKTPEGAPNVTDIRRGGGKFSVWYEYRVILGGTGVTDFKQRIDAEAVAGALRELAKNSGDWCA